MSGGVGNHVSKDDLTPGKKGRARKKLLPAWASRKGARGGGGRGLASPWAPILSVRVLKTDDNKISKGIC